MELINKNVKALDPFSPNLTQEQKELILEECKVNPQYFYERILGAKASRFTWDVIRSLPQYPDKTPGDHDGDMLPHRVDNPHPEAGTHYPDGSMRMANGKLLMPIAEEWSFFNEPGIAAARRGIGDYYKEEMVDGPTWEWCDSTWIRIYAEMRGQSGEHMQAAFAAAAREKFGSELARVRFVGMGVRYEELVWGEWKEVGRPISLDQYLGGSQVLFAENYFPTVVVPPEPEVKALPSSMDNYEALANKAWTFTMVYFAHHMNPPRSEVTNQFNTFWQEVGPEGVKARAEWPDEEYSKVRFEFQVGDGDWMCNIPGLKPRKGHHFRRIDTGSSIVMPSVKVPMSIEELKAAAIQAWNDVVREYGNQLMTSDTKLECLFEREANATIGANRVQVKVEGGEPSFSYREDGKWIPL